jgi:hypothetical protein
VASPSPSLRRGPFERFAAWVVTGPVGHLWSVVADIGLFVLGSLATRVRTRLRGGR